jgi:hypothetical protein
MPSPEHDFRHQIAVLWPAEGADAYGQTLVGDPREIMVRWRFTRTESTDAQGNTVSLDASVQVDERVDAGSLMWLGRLADIPPGTSFTETDAELYEVVNYHQTPDVKGREIKRSVGLRRYRDTLPEAE